MIQITKRVSPVALASLKEALSKIYWYKKELKLFLRNSLGDSNLLSVADWESYKIRIVSDIVDHLASNQDKYLDSLERLICDVCEMNSFTHLEKLEDGETKAKEAHQAVNKLKSILERHDTIVQHEREVARRRQEAAEERSRNQSFTTRLKEVREKYADLVISKNDPQGRGIELERVMYEIFNLFDLDPKAAFSLKGEQIDGAFSLDGTDYIFESKWHKQPISRAEMDAFAAKVNRKLDNTLGLFLSINGFSQDGVDIHSSVRPAFILMTGADLMAVLEGRIDFPELLKRKKRHASQTGKVLLEIHEF